MISIQELNDIISKMQDYKPVKAIKVTNKFFDYLDLMPRLSYTPRAEWLAYIQGVPVIIDDEIEGNYEFEY